MVILYFFLFSIVIVSRCDGKNGDIIGNEESKNRTTKDIRIVNGACAIDKW